MLEPEPSELPQQTVAAAKGDRLAILAAHHDLNSSLQLVLGAVGRHLDALDDGQHSHEREMYCSIDAVARTARKIALWVQACSPKALAADMSASGEMEHFKQGFQAASVELIANLERLLAAENSKPSELALVRASNVQYGRAAATFDGALSRIPDGASTVAMEIDLRDYLTTMVTAFEPAAEVKDLRIEVDCLDHAHVKVRAHLLDAVLHNLIGNAVKYTDQGSVTVRCRSNEGRTVQVEVVDTGIGIDPDTLLHLTEPGVRGQAANVLSRPGDGLGLASAAAAARELGGTLSFTSSLGKGTRAVLELRTTQD